MSTSEPPVLFIILESADPSLLRHGSEGGDLPVMADLFGSSITGRVDLVPGVFNAGTWPSLATGMNPARHGRCSWLRFDPCSYAIQQQEPDALRYASCWQKLDRAGRAAAVIDFPRLPLQDLRNGVQVVDWYPHDLTYGDTRTTPRDFISTHLESYPVDPCAGNCDQWTTGASALTDAMLARIDAKCDLASQLLGDYTWDHFAVTFSEAHCIGHRCWHLRPDTTGNAALSGGDPVARVYRSLDAAVGRLLKVVDAETTVLLLACPGMENSWHAFGAASEALRDVNRQMPHGLPPSNKIGSIRSEPERARAGDLSFPFPVGNGSFAVRLNLAGREKFGRIRQGAEAHAYMRELAVDMMARRGADGEPLFDDVLQTADRFNVDSRHAIPDLIFRWNRRPRTSTPRAANCEPDHLPAGRSGDHHADGLYLLHKPDILFGLGPRVRDIDVGVTIAAMANVAMPSRDGRVIRRWLEE